MTPPIPIRPSLLFVLSLSGLLALLTACSGDNRSVPAAEAEPPRTFVYECGDGYRFVTRLEGETVWLFLPERTLRLPHVPSGSGVKYGNSLATFWSKGEEAIVETGGVRHRDCVNNRRLAIWEDAKLRGVDFRAVGNEPGWHLEIRADGEILFVGDYGQSRYQFATPEPQIDRQSGRSIYKTGGGGHELKVVLEADACRDTMSGEPFETTVTVTLDGRTFTGCGRPLH